MDSELEDKRFSTEWCSQPTTAHKILRRITEVILGSNTPTALIDFFHVNSLTGWNYEIYTINNFVDMWFPVVLAAF
jgi:hypothetical protein